MMTPSDGFSIEDSAPAEGGEPFSEFAGLSSLTIEIPQQGIEYRFAQTRDADSIEVRYADGKWIDRWQSAGLALLAVVLAFAGLRFGVWTLSHPQVGCAAHMLFFVFGLVLCAIGLPLWGLLILVVVIGNAIRIACERGLNVA